MIDRFQVKRCLDSVLFPHRIALAHGTLTALALFPWLTSRETRGAAVLLGSLIIPSQVCLIALWAALATVPLLTRAGRSALWAGGLYFCILGAAATDADRFGPEFPLTLAIAEFSLLAGTVFTAFGMRQHGWRLVEVTAQPAAVSVKSTGPFQFHLADLLWWVTALCVFLALAVATIPRFQQGIPLHSYGPSAGETLLGGLCGALCIAGPIGAIAAGTFWVTMTIQDIPTVIHRGVREPLTWIVVIWTVIISSILICAGGASAVLFGALLVATVGFVGPMASSSLLLRGCGVQLQRIR